jgi:hypothetical protein
VLQTVPLVLTNCCTAQLSSYALACCARVLTMSARGRISSRERTGMSSRPGSTPERPGSIFLLPRETSYEAVAPLLDAREARPWANAPVPTIKTCKASEKMGFERNGLKIGSCADACGCTATLVAALSSRCNCKRANERRIHCGVRDKPDRQPRMAKPTCFVCGCILLGHSCRFALAIIETKTVLRLQHEA